MKFISFFIFTTVFLFLNFTQTSTISGTIIDAESITPLENAIVYLNNTSYSTSTNTKGGFGLINTSFNYLINKHIKAHLSIKNLVNNKYEVARRPAVLRPGLPRTVVTGLIIEF